ncbi:ABC transporter ATP-binding protein [Metallosphaera javensis (ex Sakai et al. 2022)]|uniref:ABC transporter ATP-binding protein n=1 Tax=Metallosphaera javensis (ex Sakai et al. 2022) TaxID=2775498 RepID=UPI0025842033|nr:MAG: trehalose/maltose import ATP-binding protein MalK [Metallosphaera javensis (ex Sakai et al. 2022)]
MFLEIRDVEVIYRGKGRPALKIPRLEVKGGEIVLIQGRTGSGKSTFLNLLNGVIPDIVEAEVRGEIRMGGRRLVPGEGQPVVVGSLFQDPDAQLVHQYVMDEIGFGLENLGYSPREIESKVRKVASLLNISHLLHREIRELSLGEKQVVMLASVIAMEPELLVMDEPTSNLDPWETRQVLELIGKLGITTIIAEHKPEFRKIADKVVTLVNGEIGEVEIPTEYPSASTRSSDNGITLLAKIQVKTGDRVILNTSLELPRGVNALLGRNGSGKTTMLRAISGLLPRNFNFEGYILVNGKDISKLSPRQRGRVVGYLPQDVQLLFSRDTVAKELASCTGRTDVEVLLKRFGLQGYGDEDPFYLSTGQARRLAMACVLASGVEVVLLDEPTTGQDIESRLRLGDELRGLGKTILISTHDPLFARSFADQILLLENGTVRKLTGDILELTGSGN